MIEFITYLFGPFSLVIGQIIVGFIFLGVVLAVVGALVSFVSNIYFGDRKRW